MAEEGGVMSLLTGDMDLKTEMKKFLKKYKELVIIIILLAVVGSWYYMFYALKYSFTQVIFVYAAVGIVVLMLIKMIKDMSRGGSSKSGSREDLLERRSKLQQQVDDIDERLVEREMKLQEQIDDIRTARTGKYRNTTKPPRKV
jgi:ABC-type protease/lipase transport system fused ATPase/permease subunit